jgi:APA family basic amino acid/polyamine antiporter
MLNQPAPLVVAVQAAADRAAGTACQSPMAIVKILVAVGALAGLSSVMVVNMLAQPRIFLAMSRDGLLPPWAGRVHPRFRTPHVSTIVTGIVVATAAGLPPIDTLGNLVSIGTLMAFVIVSMGVIVLRRTQPDLPRPFRVPLGSAASSALGAGEHCLDDGAALGQWQRLILWMAIGVALCAGYGYRKSRLRTA